MTEVQDGNDSVLINDHGVLRYVDRESLPHDLINGGPTMNGHYANGSAHGVTEEEKDGGVDRHYAYFRWAYEQANQTWCAQKVKDTYDAAKRSSNMLESTLNEIETRVVDVSRDYASPLYANYVYPTTDRLAKVYVHGMESTKPLRDTTMAVAAKGGSVSVNLAVITAQLSLIANAAITSVLLDGMIAMKNVGKTAVAGTVMLEQSLADGINRTIETSRQLAKIPVDKFNEHANGFLDIANAVVDNHFNMPMDEELTSDQPTNSNVTERVGRLSRRLLHLLQTRAHDDILEPAQRQLNGLVEQLRKSLALVGQLKERRGELSDSMHDLWSKLDREQLSGSAHEVWSKIEAEAKEYKISPEEALIRSIHRCSSVLNSYVGKLREKSSEVVPASAMYRLDALASYVEQLDTSLSKAGSVDEVTSEVLDEAKQKLDDVTTWAKSFRNSTESV